ncbi:MAG TPA: hypothetical protein VL242_07065 [Sorangium sp.]|nr:hypothetical protein [Sorangium sp.]
MQSRLPAFWQAASAWFRLMYACGFTPRRLSAFTFSLPTGSNGECRRLPPSGSSSTVLASKRSTQNSPRTEAMPAGHPLRAAAAGRGLGSPKTARPSAATPAATAVGRASDRVRSARG